MFGLGMMEILMILALALIVVGPKKLPELAKTLGRAMGEFKRSAQDLKRSIDVETTVKDMEVPKTDLKDVIKETRDTKKEKTDADFIYTQDDADPDQNEAEPTTQTSDAPSIDDTKPGDTATDEALMTDPDIRESEPAQSNTAPSGAPAQDASGDNTKDPVQ